MGNKNVYKRILCDLLDYIGEGLVLKLVVDFVVVKGEGLKVCGNDIGDVYIEVIENGIY